MNLYTLVLIHIQQGPTNRCECKLIRWLVYRVAQKIIIETQKICDAILEKTIFEHSKSKRLISRQDRKIFPRQIFWATLHIDVQVPLNAILIKCIMKIIIFYDKNVVYKGNDMYKYGCLCIYISGDIQHPKTQKITPFYLLK